MKYKYEDKISLWQIKENIVKNNVYLDMTHWSNYVTNTDDFWSNKSECPVTRSDVERKPVDHFESAEEEEKYWTFDYMEAWAVSPWLANELYERNEWVARFDYLPNIWFRNATGMSILCESTFDDIARKWLVAVGRCTEEQAKQLNPCD